MAQIHGERLKYYRYKLIYIWEMAQVFEKWLPYVGNDVDMWEKALVFYKRPKYVGIDSEILGIG